MGYRYQKYPSEFRTTRNGPNHRLYQTWYDMLKRIRPDSADCSNYFDKGIYVCMEWTYWPNFAAWARANGYTDELELDRIDGTKNYEPSNCRFVTELVQTRNRNTEKVSASCFATQLRIHAKEFVCVETGKRYMIQAEASRDTGVSQSSISNALNGTRSIGGGFHWKYI